MNEVNLNKENAKSKKWKYDELFARIESLEEEVKILKRYALFNNPADFVIRDGVLVDYKGDDEYVKIPYGVKEIREPADFYGGHTIFYKKNGLTHKSHFFEAA